MKILIEESVLRQALETFTHCYAETDRRINERAKLLVELRTSLDAAEKVEPVAWMITTSNSNLHPLDPNRESNWLTFDLIDFKRNCARSLKVEGSTPLYTAPAVPESVEPVAKVSDWDINSMDAAVWAKAFADRFTVWSQEHGVESDTFGLMVGWFSNAIMAGYDEAVRRNPSPAVPSYDAEKWQLVPKVATLAMIEAVSLFDQHSCVHTYRAMLAAAPKPEDK